MTHRTRIRIAAASTALFVGGLSAAGVGLRADRAGPSGAVSSASPARTGSVAAQPAAPRSKHVAYSAESSEEGRAGDD